MDSGIEIFWPNYKVGTRQNFQPGNGLRKSNPDFSPIETSKLTLNAAKILHFFNQECLKNLQFQTLWPGQRDETFKKRWMRQTLTLTDVLNGSVICVDKQTIVIINRKEKQPECAVLQSLRRNASSQKDVNANTCVHVSLRHAACTAHVWLSAEGTEQGRTGSDVIGAMLTRGSFCRSV